MKLHSANALGSSLTLATSQLWPKAADDAGCRWPDSPTLSLLGLILSYRFLSSGAEAAAAAAAVAASPLRSIIEEEEEEEEEGGRGFFPIEAEDLGGGVSLICICDSAKSSPGQT